MRIGIDYHAVSGIPQGNQTYIRNLISNILLVDGSNDYIIYSKKHFEKPVFGVRNVRSKSVLSSNAVCRLGIDLPRYIAWDKLDIFHSIYISPIPKRCRYVLTVHDILFEHYPQFFNKAFIIRSKMFVRKSIKNADQIITISTYSREAISTTYGIDQNKIVVTPLGVDETFRPNTDIKRKERVMRKYAITEPYILFIGRIEPRKNLPTLIRAFSKIIKEGFDNYFLVIGGEKDFGFNSIFSCIESLSIGEKVIFTGKISQDDLPVLYSGAELFVYPSFFEGFGLPVLEAMACGVPVVTSKTSSLYEIVGNAGILVDPFEIDSVAEGIRRLLSDEKLCEEYKVRGIQRAKSYSWKQCAQKTLQVYKSLSN